jgi:UDP-glucose 4-epimerase
MTQKVLVTGGTGYIGSHTVVALQEAGYEVIIADNLENSFPQVLDGITKTSGIKPGFIRLDLRDRETVRSFFQKEKDFSGIIHFAAYKAVGESVENPLAYYQNNLGGLMNLLEEMLENGIRNLVFSSSCTVYGEPETLPVTENSPVKAPESPYGNTKKISEEIIRDCVEAWPGLKAICLRYFNPIGAHASGYIGELPIGPPNNLIPIVTQTAIGKREKVTVFGTDYPTPDGSCIRDYIHVMDLAKAHVKALERLISGSNKANCEYFNLGTGKGYSVLEVLNTFEKVSGLKLNYVLGERRNGDVVQIYADTAYANEELGWQANETLEEMVRSAWQWEQNIPKVYGQGFIK